MKMRQMNNRKPRVIVVGGGFAGVNFINHLSAKAYDVTLVDKNNFNYFTPLLYQVATGFLEPSNISYPLRRLVNAKGFTFRQGEVSSINADANQIILTDGDTLEYDILVIAAGAKTNFFGNEVPRERAFELKAVSDSLAMRNAFNPVPARVAVEKASVVRTRFLTIVIAGGRTSASVGASMLAELIQRIDAL